MGKLPMGKPPTLYHFTCAHGHQGIGASQRMEPHRHPFMPGLGPLLWLSDLAEPPSRESLGLTAMHLRCDRLAYRYVTQTRAAIRWGDIRRRAPAQVVADLEAFGLPEHWWVARRPLLPSEFSLDTSYTRKEEAELLWTYI